MILKEYLGILLFLFFTSFVFSQEKQFRKGMIALENFAFIKAGKLFEEAKGRGYESKELYRKLGDSYYFISDLDKAAYWYGKLLTRYPDDMTLEYANRYIHSLKSMKAYKKADDIKRQFYKNDLQKAPESNSLKYLTEIDDLSWKFSLDTLDINSKYSDYAPSFYQEKLIFTSSRNSGRITRFVHEWNNEPFLDLYTTNISGSSRAKKVLRLKGAVNTKFHESSTTFSKDQKTVYFTRSNFSKKELKTNRKGQVLLKVFRANCNGKKWTDIEELPFNSDEYSVSHPAISDDGNFLYFASDMPGGYGESDLYVVTINENGSFGIPQNLGNRINTPGKETFPYISNNGRLFFASNGHPGLGGLDVFMATINETGTLVVNNLGKPINSAKDDFTFVINEEKGIGYFASNREGGEGGDDIYGFHQIAPLPDHYRSFKINKSLERQIHHKKDIITEPVISAF